MALVTAAGYPSQPEKYEQRLVGLRQGMLDTPELPDDLCKNLFVLGGECSYLFQFSGRSSGCHLQEIPAEAFQPPEMLAWKHEDIKFLLDSAQRCIESFLSRLKIDATVIRKERALGMLPNREHGASSRVTREVLDELALLLVDELGGAAGNIPYTAFNGGSDTWLDVGSKQIGVQSLQHYIGASAQQTLHVGDQFLVIGNDYGAYFFFFSSWENKRSC